MTDHKPPREAEGGDGAIHPVARPFLWLDKTRARDAISLCIVLIAVILLVVDFFVHRHGETAIAERPGFFAIFGFISFAFAVLSGWPLRRLLSRPADYYGESETDNG